jgi:hypothetical protein
VERKHEVGVDAYVIDVLMPDLVGHDRRPSAFLVYLHLWRRTGGAARAARVSHRMVAEATGLSKRAVQLAFELLVERRLVTRAKGSATAAPLYTLRCPWRRASGRSSEQ